MLFRVTGQNKETGGRMSLELDAPSKAVAERKAASSGMTNPRAEAVGPGELPAASVRAKTGGGSGKLILIALILLAAVAFVFRAKLLAIIGK